MAIKSYRSKKKHFTIFKLIPGSILLSSKSGNLYHSFFEKFISQQGQGRGLQERSHNGKGQRAARES